MRVNWLLLLISLFGSALLADSLAYPNSWMAETKDGKSVFVMLSPEWPNERNRNEENADEYPEGYSVSGLYRKGDKSTPVYTVSWYAYRVDLSNDGRYLIRPGPWATDRSDMAVAFYDRGELLRFYRINELTSFTSPFEHTISHFFWKKSWDFDQESNELAIETKTFTSFRFDATTGEIISSYRGDYLGFAVLLALFLAVAVVVAYRIKRRSEGQRPQKQ